jgi:hypothetical protein
MTPDFGFVWGLCIGSVLIAALVIWAFYCRLRDVSVAIEKLRIAFEAWASRQKK